MNIGMQFVEIGNPGNPADPVTGGAVGSVSYAFRMGKYEVTNNEYVQFLNSVDPFGSNLLALYETGMSGESGGITVDLARPYAQKYAAKTARAAYPVTHLSYYAVMRFVNWLHGGNTESGAYTLTSLEPSLYSLARNSGAKFWIPNRDEWHKSAYYHGPNSALQAVYGTDYSLYPTGGFSATGSAPPGSADSANFNNVVGGFVQVGSYPQSLSHYGTADQGGNAEEWYERISWIGGSFESPETYLRASRNPNSSTTGGGGYRGFRVAALSSSQLAPVIPVVQATTAVELQWISQVGIKYQVQSSDNMVSWTDIGIPLVGNGSTMSSLQAIRSNRKFYRLIVIP